MNRNCAFAEADLSGLDGLSETGARPQQAANRDDAPGGSVDRGHLDSVIAEALNGLKDDQNRDGHWCFDLEADATIPAEYIMLHHYLGEIDQTIVGRDYTEIERRICLYLRRIQEEHGGWPLYYRGDFNISASVKAYFALKLAGEDIDAPHMVRARNAILAHGGLADCNVFTRIALCLFEQLPWRAVPTMPPEILFLPKWFPFHIDKVAYWSRTVMIPLFVLGALKPKAVNPKRIDLRELMVKPADQVRCFMHNPTGTRLGDALIKVDKFVHRFIDPYIPAKLRAKAIGKCVAWTTERLNGEDGVGAIFPAMANTVMAFEALGYAKDHPDLVIAKESIEKLVTDKGEETYVQPCLSPVWDTSLAAHAVMEAGAARDGETVQSSLDWLVDLQITDKWGDWAIRRPGLRGGGWAFQYRNDHYPDVDDTAVVALALDRGGNPKHREAIDRAAEWVVGMQSSNGGWGAFDAENEHYHLNSIPFADHGALLDPPTADVSARCLSFLGQLGYGRSHPTVAKAIDYLRREQEPDGSWFGRWGTNYIYGTWSVLCSLNAVGEDMSQPHVRRAVEWMLSRQNADGGWGEDGASYESERKCLCKASTPSQTSWALMGLMAAGEVDHPAVERGVQYLLTAERQGDTWEEPWFTAVGFPKVFYLRYHGYRRFFPLWALARYRNLKDGNARQPVWGM